jgi:hypothetical protein
MSFKTPFLPENQPKSLYDFGFYKINRQTKSVVIDMLKNFFDSMNKLYQLQLPDIIAVQNTTEATKLFIERDFPYAARKLPLIIVAIKGATERKMYIGADNLTNYDIEETSSGQSAVEVYQGAADITLALIIVTPDPESRMRLTEMVTMCFTHYYRWQYFYTLGDGNLFSITPNTTQLEFGAESEATEAGTSTTPLYLVDITMKCFIEYTFRDVSEIHGDLAQFTIDETSGPVES